MRAALSTKHGAEFRQEAEIKEAEHIEAERLAALNLPLDHEDSGNSPIQKIPRLIVNMPLFGPLMNMLIMINTVVLCMDYAGASDSWKNSLESTNQIFTFMFAAEAGLKFLGLGPRLYIKDRWNLFDLAAVVASLIEMFASSNRSMSSLRALRMFKIVNRSGPQYKGLQTFIRVVVVAIGETGNLMFIVGLTVLIFALLGMQARAPRFLF